MGVQVVDKGWEKIKQQLDLLDKSYSKIGVLKGSEKRTDTEKGGKTSKKKSGKSSKNKTISNAQLGVIHEFGSEDGRIQERSHFRSSFFENEDKYEKSEAKLLDKIYAGSVDVKKALDILGQMAEADIRKKIVDLKDPPLAPSTIAQRKKNPKGESSTNPLAHTGQYLRAIASQSVIKGKTGVK